VLVLVMAVLLASYASSMRAYLQQRHELQTLRASIALSSSHISTLRREKRRWSDPAYVEAQARQRFGWVLPGEIGYQVIGANGKPLGHHDSLSDPTALTEANRPLWWQTAWGSVVAAGRTPKAEAAAAAAARRPVRPPAPAPAATSH
jgi:cell division protein FtsB